MIRRAPFSLWLLALVLGGCAATLDEPCEGVGIEDACAEGLVCVADPEPVCRAICEDHGDCPGPRACRAAEGCGDEVRACQEKD